jgi:hypothetical protein
MTRKQLMMTMLFLAAGGLSAAARAGRLDLTLVDPDVVVTQGGTVAAFDATITNTSTATIFLNGDSFDASSPLGSVDDSPFYSNAPLSLTAGQTSGPFELFDVSLNASTPVGTYGGTGNVFSILGGGDENAFADLADTHFEVSVVAAVTQAPEIDAASAGAALTLLLGSLLVVRERRIVSARR